MKKFLATFLACVMLAASAAGCSSGAETDSTPSQEGGSSSSQAEPSAPEGNTDPITVWVHPFLGPDRAAENEQYFEDIAAQLKEETGVDATVQVIPWLNRDQKMLMAFSANKGPDVVYLITDHLAQFASTGVLEPLDSYIPADLKSDYLESALNATTVEGNIYGMPMLMTVNATVFNTTLLNEIGWDTSKLPNTWEELEEMFELAKQHGKYGLLYQGGENGNLSLYPFLWQAGGDVLDATGKVIFDSPETRHALTKLNEWYQKGYMPTDSLTLVGSTQINMLWESGDVCLSIHDGGTTANYINGTTPLNFDIQVTTPLTDKETAGYGTVGSWCVATTSGNKEAAANYIMTMLEEENLKTFLTTAGYMPPVKSLSNMYDGNLNMKAMSDSIAYLKPGVVHPAGRTITTTIIPPLVQAVMSGEDIDAKIQEAVQLMESAVTDSLALKTE